MTNNFSPCPICNTNSHVTWADDEYRSFSFYPNDRSRYCCTNLNKHQSFVLFDGDLEWLEPPRKRVEQRSEIRIDSSKISPQTQENSSAAHQEVSQQQQLNIKPSNHVSDETKNEIRQLAQKVDIQLPQKCEVYNYPIEKIFLALNLVFLRNKRDLIDNRIGLLIDCLRWEYWEEPENKRLLQKAGIITPDSPYYEYYI
ncbi:hypothetical protein [uncultured Nostoc sp.]|uniref:hypothetical protein n=1 Tax=uncultured Nostoc sp. TaxID=340711 RepID=UPI0035C9B701